MSDFKVGTWGDLKKPALKDILAATLFRWKGNHWGSTMLPYPSCPEADACRKGVDVLLSELEAAGYQVVPVKPTLAMVDAAAGEPDDWHRELAASYWRDMLSAAPKVG